MPLIVDGGGWVPSLPPLIPERKPQGWIPPEPDVPPGGWTPPLPPPAAIPPGTPPGGTGGPPVGMMPQRLPQESWLPPLRGAPAAGRLSGVQMGPPPGLAGGAFLPTLADEDEEERKRERERRKLQLYDLVNLPALVWERMGGKPALGVKPGAKTLIDDLVENPGDALWKRRAEIIYGAVWKWGAETMYELSKLPERAIWLEMRAVEEGKPFMPIGLDPGLMTSREAAALWTLIPEADRTITVEREWGELEEGTWEDVSGWLREGEIGYTFVRYPERLEPFRTDLAAGMDTKAAVGKYEDFWLELGLNTLIDPGWFIPTQAMKVIWPGGVLAGKAIGAVGKGGARAMGKVLGPIGRRALDWLTEYTARSTISTRGDAAVDAVTELILRSPADGDVLEVVNRALMGDLDTGMLATRTQTSLQNLSEQLDGDTLEGVMNRFFSEEVSEAWADEALQPLLREDPMLLPYLLGQAAESAAAQELGYVPAYRSGGLRRALDFAGGLLKEQWLSINPAYVLANSTDNTIKCWLMGHLVNPLDLPAPDRIAGYLADYGTSIPSKVAESMVAEELGSQASGRIRRIPIPGVGRPAEIVDFWGGLVHKDLRATWPWLEAVAPKRPSELLVHLDLAEPPSRLASALDNVNYAAFSERGRDLSGRVEQTARAQIFWDTFKRHIDETARPTLLATARGLGLSEDLIGALSRVKSPGDITRLLPETDVVPIVRLSSLIPEGVDVEALGYAAKTLDGMQDDALARGTPEAIDGLRVYIDDLFGTLREQARRVTEAADIEEVVTAWRAAQIREAVGSTLGRAREVSDALLSQVRAAVIKDPEAASSLWPRYFDSKHRISTEVQQEVSRMVRQRTPAMSDAVDGLLGRFEDATADELAKGMSYADWGLFGEQLSGLRDLTDEAEDVAWKAFMEGDLTPERLSALENVQHELQGIWRATAAEAKVWREGYLAQKGTHKVTGERYQQRMLEIWRDQGFVPVRDLWQDASGKLGAVEVAEAPAARVTWLAPSAELGGGPARGAAATIGEAEVGTFLPDTRQLALSSRGDRLDHFTALEFLVGKEPDEEIEATQRLVRILRSAGPDKTLHILPWGFDPSIGGQVGGERVFLEDLQGALRALSGMKGSEAEVVEAAMRPVSGTDLTLGEADTFQGTIQEVLDEVSARLRPSEAIVPRAKPRWFEMFEGEDALEVREATRKYSWGDWRNALFTPDTGEMALGTGSVIEHADIWQQITGGKSWFAEAGEFSAEVTARRPIKLTYVPEEHGVFFRHLEGGTQSDFLRDMRGALQALLDSGAPKDVRVVTSRAPEETVFGGEIYDAPLREVLDEIESRLAQLDLAERAPALVDSAAELAEFRRERGLSDEMVNTFRSMQKSDPDAALQWFMEQRGDAQLRLQQDAQAGFVEETGQAYSERMRGQANDLIDGLDGWQVAIRDRLGEASRTRALQVGEREALQGNLDTLAKSWAEHLDTGSMKGSLETGRVLFDYTRTKRWEAGIGTMFPFTKWQLRNPFIWRDILEKQPGAFSLLTRYADASERERERMGTSTRFKGMAPIPGQEWLQEQGVLPEGYWGVDPKALMSAASQIREPFLSPEEEEMGLPAQILHAPERVGMTLWPWIQQAAAAGGLMGAPSWGATGPFERTIPAVRQGVEALQEQFIPGGAPGGEWTDRYWTQQTLTAWLAEGKISAEDATAPTPELLAEAQQEAAGMQQLQAMVRWLQPFGVKHARPGEMDVRNLRAEMRDMPPERAAYMRTLHPEVAAYQRALTGVEEPEIADYDAQVESVNLRYDRMMEGVPPWHPRASEIQSQRAAELGALEAEKPPEEEWVPEEGTLQQLEKDRPRPETFEAEGVIDWDAFREAEAAYVGEVEAAGIEPEAYKKYRRRYMSPLELAWELREQRQDAGWGEFERLRGAEAGPTPEVPELGRWITSEMQRRMGQGWKAADVVAWAGEQQRLPYDEITRILEEQYGPTSVRDMLPEVLAERPWLEGQPYGAEEWGGVEQWLDVEMPGMFTPRTEEALAQRQITDWYYDLMPQQRREMRHRLRLDEEVDFSVWVKSDEAKALQERVGARGGPASLEHLYHTLRPPSARERQETELEMVRFQRGAGEWTPRLERYYSDPDSPKSKFWNLRDTLVLSADAYDDPVLGAALVESNRNALGFSDAQYQGAFDYLQANRDRFVDEDAMAMAEAHPDWFKKAQDQRPEVQRIEIPEEVSDEYWSLTTGDERTAWQEANPEAWKQLTTVWEERKVAQIGNPYYTYAYQHGKYEQWFGDTPPGKVDAKKALASFREAKKDMEAFHADEGEWTAAMDRWYGKDSAKDRWWDAYWAAKSRLNRDAWDDAAITATFDKELQAALPVDALEYLFEEAITRLSRYLGAPEPKPWEIERAAEEEAVPAPSPSGGSGGGGGGGGLAPPPPPPPPPQF